MEGFIEDFADGVVAAGICELAFVGVLVLIASYWSTRKYLVKCGNTCWMYLSWICCFLLYVVSLVSCATGPGILLEVSSAQAATILSDWELCYQTSCSR